MIATVAVVIVNSEAFVDPRLDTSTPTIRDIFSKAVGDGDSFQLLTISNVSQSEDAIRSAVRDLITGRRNSVDWILVVGGIGFEDGECTPEVRQRLRGLLVSFTD